MCLPCGRHYSRRWGKSHGQTEQNSHSLLRGETMNKEINHMAFQMVIANKAKRGG